MRSGDVAGGKPPGTSSRALLRLLQPFLWGPPPIGLFISVHDTHVVNTVGPVGPEVPDQKVSLLFRGLWWEGPHNPPYFPKYCDGCNARFSISHALDCKRGGLVTARHNEICDGVADLAGKDFTPSHVRNDPLIY